MVQEIPNPSGSLKPVGRLPLKSRSLQALEPISPQTQRMWMEIRERVLSCFGFAEALQCGSVSGERALALAIISR